MARTRSLISLLTIIALFGLALPIVIAQESTGKYTGFWYETDGEGNVNRVAMEGDQYEERRRKELQEVWIPMFRAFLNGQLDAYIDHPTRPVTSEEAQAMIRLDTTTADRIATNPIYREEMAKQMAEWSLYFDQLQMWNAYVEQSVVRDTLTDEERITYSPNTLRTDLELIYESLQQHAQEVVQAQKERQETMLARIESNRIGKQQYENWLADRESEVIQYARQWARRYDGSEIEMDGTIYLVRQSDSQAVSEEVAPDNSIILNVPPEQQTITPFDLLNEDGTMKKPE